MDGSAPTTSGGKIAAQAALGIWLVLTSFILISSWVNAKDTFNAIMSAAAFITSTGIQAYFLWKVTSKWDGMSTAEKWKAMAGGILLPIAAIFFGLVAIALALIALIMSGFSSAFSGSGSQSSTRYGPADISDGYGNRLGSIDRYGDIKDKSGNRLGSIDQYGDVRDKYGDKKGSVD